MVQTPCHVTFMLPTSLQQTNKQIVDQNTFQSNVAQRTLITYTQEPLEQHIIEGTKNH